MRLSGLFLMMTINSTRGIKIHNNRIRRRLSVTAVISRTTLNPPKEIKGKSSFRVISWNVNGIRAVLRKQPEIFQQMVEAEQEPDVICLQESKIQQIHEAAISDQLQDLGYDIFFSSSVARKGYAGTITLINKKHTNIKATYGIPGLDVHNSEGRLITVEFQNFFLLNTYVPNSGDKLKRIQYRLGEWDRDFRDYLDQLEKEKPVILTGDLNVAHLDQDIHNPHAPHIKTSAGTTPEERASFALNILKEKASNGRIDAFRFFHPSAEGHFTYWSTRTRARAGNRGLRLDYFVLSRTLLPKKDQSDPDTQSGAPILAQDCHHLYDESYCALSDHGPITLLLKSK